jgi:hypothetical protein
MQPKLKIIGVLAVVFFVTIFTYSQSAVVIVENANLRGTPNQNGKVVDILLNGSSIEIIKQSGAWFLLQTSEYVGWLHGNTIRLNESVEANYSVPNEYVTPNRKKKSVKTTSTPRKSASSRRYYLGPRGGCYYLTASGNKQYVDRSLCQ